MLWYGVASLLVATSMAAVPPMSDSDRIEAAENIVVGKIKWVEVSLLEKGDEYVDAVAKASIDVILTDKGEALSSVSWWTVRERPAGWSGLEGQSENPPDDAIVRFFATSTGELLTPNGWEALDEVGEGEELVVVDEDDMDAEEEVVEYLDSEETAKDDQLAGIPTLDDAEPDVVLPSGVTGDAVQEVDSNPPPWRIFFRKVARLAARVRNFFARRLSAQG